MRSLFYKTMLTLLTGVFIIACEKEENPAAQITGELFSNTQCKDFFKTNSEADITPDSLSCIDYNYNQKDSILTLKHINAGFNCCPEELWCEINTKADTLIIEEFEKSAMCDCDCLYDLDIVLNSVQQTKYIIKFIEPYARDQAELIFEIDLSEETSGSFCVARKMYPWGIYY